MANNQQEIRSKLRILDHAAASGDVRSRVSIGRWPEGALPLTKNTYQ